MAVCLSPRQQMLEHFGNHSLTTSLKCSADVQRGSGMPPVIHHWADAGCMACWGVGEGEEEPRMLTTADMCSSLSASLPLPYLLPSLLPCHSPSSLRSFVATAMAEGDWSHTTTTTTATTTATITTITITTIT